MQVRGGFQARQMQNRRQMNQPFKSHNRRHFFIDYQAPKRDAGWRRKKVVVVVVGRQRRGPDRCGSRGLSPTGTQNSGCEHDCR